MPAEHRAFDRALRSRSDRFETFPELPGDNSFLLELAVRCSPLASLLPASVLEQQAAAQEASHRTQHPGAMRRIVAVAGVRAGRIVIDWGAGGHSHGVDIAILPELRSSGVGLHMLRAWLEVADEGQWSCTLDVNRDNRAALLYTRLGFAAVEQAGDETSPFMRMARPARRRPAGQESSASALRPA